MILSVILCKEINYFSSGTQLNSGGSLSLIGALSQDRSIHFIFCFLFGCMNFSFNDYFS